jgi:hypothetical protein
VQRRSRLSIQFLGVPNRALYWVGLAVWVLSAVVVIAHPRVEDLLARKVYLAREFGRVQVLHITLHR